MWSTENWVQDDTKLSGYPSPAGTAYPEAFSLDGFVSLWKKSASGYFIPSEDISPFSIDGFATIWLFNENFDGYPHPTEFPAENPYFMYIGTRPVEELFIGETLIWKDKGINTITIPELS